MASERRNSDKKRATKQSAHPFPPFLYLSLRHFITAAENNTMRISQVCSHMFEFVRRVMQAASS
jgi:predicted secreted protein